MLQARGLEETVFLIFGEVLRHYETPNPHELFYLDLHDSDFPLPYRVIQLDYSKLAKICVRVDVYPLIWVGYLLLRWLDVINLRLLFIAYQGLKRTKGNIDFIHRSERIGGWLWLFSKYWRI